MTEFHSPEETGLSWHQINEYAEDLAQRLYFKPGGNLKSIVEKLGGKIHYVDLDTWHRTDSGSVVVYKPQDFDIYISNFTTPLRDRFTVAHELGHYVLHSMFGEKSTPMSVERHGNTVVEREADVFAAAFLMPIGLIEESMESGVTPEEISRKFKVSTAAAGWRMDEVRAKT